MLIGIDMMGGDYAPLEAVKGVQLYFSGHNIPADLLLIGDEQQIKDLLDTHQVPRDHIRIAPATQVIDMHEHPTRAMREKPDSSIAVGFKLLATKKMDAFLSAGNTGAMMVGALFALKPVEGVIRPAISTIIPKTNGGTALLLDVGLNADCKPEQLNQFAVMGSVYANLVLGIENPRVGLINVGEEETKGNTLTQSTYPLLKANSSINFIGNIEGREVLLGDQADVMICEGFTGNIILKMAESLFDVGEIIQVDHPYLKRFDFENYGGTPVLGISRPVIIGHGISHAKAFMNMIHLAQIMVEKMVVERVCDGLSS
jgi:glycerol-3-phosphate acyltransferase PlsX